MVDNYCFSMDDEHGGFSNLLKNEAFTPYYDGNPED
jgi:hypothetical protein